MKTKLNLLVALALMLGLVFASPPPAALAAEAALTLASSPNPSAAYQEVTLTLSGTGTDPNYPPFGYVTFFDNGAAISYCDRVPLNFTGSMPAPGMPAVCTTKLTTVGVHTITAFFDSMVPDLYADAWATLEGGHAVTERLPITFTPQTLEDATYGMYSERHITPICPGGVACELAWWGIEGTLPPGTNFASSTPAQIWGEPRAAGEFSFTVMAETSDASGAAGSQAYTWNVLKATPQVRFEWATISGGMINLAAAVYHPSPFFSYDRPAGLMSFSVDGVPLAACSGEYARPVDTWWGSAGCYAEAPADLLPGSHSVQADFTPDEATAANYNSGSGTSTLDIPGRITGLLFQDLNQDGIRDAGEEPVASWLTLDQGCDGYMYDWAYSDSEGWFAFQNVNIGSTYCLAMPNNDDWRITSVLDPFVADGSNHFEVGVRWIGLSFSPERLPNGSAGEPYSQTVEVSGGIEPYSIIDMWGVLPEGLAFDQETFTLSGTPTVAGPGYLALTVSDADGVIGRWSSQFAIQTDGVFSLTSDTNPSAAGQAVIFTFGGSGNAVWPEYGPVAPFGLVDFYAGEALMAGCEAVPLNIDPEYGLIDRPATCTTSALAIGDHEIRAVFTSDQAIYRDASRTLTQTVQEPVASASADLAIRQSDSKDPIKAGAKLDYTLIVSNAGPDAAENIVLLDVLDRNTTYVSTKAPRGWTCTYANSQVTCTSASLASGGSATIKITVTVNSAAKVGKELVNNVTVSSDTFDPNLLDNSVVEKTMVTK
jgi:uncharacterized repeat protein (TIGR01451 family)